MAEETANQESEAKETPKTVSADLPSIYGVKAGMTRIFDELGNHIPVTVVKLIPNFVSQVKTVEKDGYEAYQVAYGEKREKLVIKSKKGHLAKAGVEKALTQFAEVQVSGPVDAALLGKEVTLGAFSPDTFVDVTGTSKGKGFQGVIKRYGFSGGPMTHGSKFHRRTGSIGNRATPGKVHKEKKMPGHMGVETKTVQNLKVVEVNHEKGYLLIRGSVPGCKSGFVRVAKARKK